VMRIQIDMLRCSIAYSRISAMIKR